MAAQVKKTKPKGGSNWLMPVIVSVVTSVLVTTIVGGFRTVEKVDRIEGSLTDFKDDTRKQSTELNAKFDRALSSLVDERNEIVNLSG